MGRRFAREDENAAPETRSRFERMEDRDSLLEARYRLPACCGKGCCPSVLACVTAHGERRLADDFMRWVHAEGLRADAQDSLHAWAIATFGDRLYPSAHGVMRFYIKTVLYGDPYKRKKPERAPRVTPGLTDEERLARMNVALSKLVDEKAMPEEGKA